MDQDLRDLVEQLRELTRNLDAIKPSGAASGGTTQNLDRGIDRMIAALAQLSVKLDGTKRTRAAEEEAVKHFGS